MSGSIKLPDGSSLDRLELTSDVCLNSVIIAYGARNTGKTTAIFGVMHSVRDIVDEVHVISQSAGANNQFADYVPARAIRTDLRPEWIQKLLATQKEKAKTMRDFVENTEILKSLFERCAGRRDRLMMINIVNRTKDYVEEARKKYESDEEGFLYTKMMMEKKRDAVIKKHQKETIKKNIELLSGMELSMKERKAIANFNMNPHILLIFDDCASALKEWTRKNPGITEAIYNGRHYYMTVIITAQADTTIDNKIRGNATLTIYTDPMTAGCNIEREHKNDKKRGLACINAIWRKSTKMISFKKLVYMSATPNGDPFRYVVMTIRDPFHVGSKAFWDRCEKATR